MKIINLRRKCRLVPICFATAAYGTVFFSMGASAQDLLLMRDSYIVCLQAKTDIPDQLDAKILSCNTIVNDREMLSFISKEKGSLYKVYANLASALYAKGQCKKAIAAAMMSVSVNPNHFAAYTIMGECYSDLGDFDLAKESYNTALALAPNEKYRVMVENSIVTNKERADVAARKSREESIASEETKKREFLKTQRQATLKEKQRISDVKKAAAESVAKRLEDLTRRFPPDWVAKIQAHEIEKGWTKAAVVESLGTPKKRTRTPDGTEQWVYQSRKVVFVGGVVSFVGK